MNSSTISRTSGAISNSILFIFILLSFICIEKATADNRFGAHGFNFSISDGALEHITKGEIRTNGFDNQSPKIWGGMHSVEGFKEFLKLRPELHPSDTQPQNRSSNVLQYFTYANETSPVYLGLPPKVFSSGAANSSPRIDEGEASGYKLKTLYPLLFNLSDLRTAIQFVIENPEKWGTNRGGLYFVGTFNWRIGEKDINGLRIFVQARHSGQVISAYPTLNQPNFQWKEWVSQGNSYDLFNLNFKQPLFTNPCPFNLK